MDLEKSDCRSSVEKSAGLKLYEEARALMHLRKYQDAVVLFQQAAAEEPHAKTYELLGECFLLLRRYKEAIPFLAAATTLSPSVRAPALLAEAWLGMKSNVEALDAVKIALSRDPRNKRALQLQGVISRS